MAKVLSSISGNLISAASAGYAPTNSADVSAIASAYQVVSATGTQTYAGTAYVTSLNSAPVSAERAGNASNAGLANSAWYDGTGRLISALPDSAAVSAIASAYASGKQDSSAMSAYALSSDVSGVIDTVSGNSAAWGETAYIPLSSTAIEMTSTAYSASYNLESIDLFVKDADSSNVLIAPDGISFKSGNGTNIGFVDPYHIGNWDGVYNTVSTNSASWTGGGGGGGIDSATCSAIASSYAASAASGKQNSGNYISAGGLNQRITGTGTQAVSFASGTNGTYAGLWITGQFSTAYYKDNELKLSRNNHMIAFNIGGQGPKISAMAYSKNQHSMLYLYQYGNYSATYSETGFTAVDSASSILLKYDTAEYTKLTSVYDTVSANSASWGGGGGGGIDSATCSAIASSYAESAVSSKQDSSAMSAYALSADVSGVIDTVSSNSASWGGGATGDYVEKSATILTIGSNNTALYEGAAIGTKNSASDEAFAHGSNNRSYHNSLSQGYYNTASSNSFALGDVCFAESNSIAVGRRCSASGTSFAQGYYVSSRDTTFAFGKYNLRGNGSVDSAAFAIGDGTAANARHDLMLVTKNGEITMYSSTADATGIGLVSSITSLSAQLSGVTALLDAI